MKKLLSIVALVAMIAVASVAQAATVVVSGEVGEVSTITNCSGATFPSGEVANSLNIENTINQASCTGTVTTTVAAGYDLTYVATTATLVSGSDVIESGATCAATNVECFSYNFNNSDPTGADPASAGSEHAVPTVAEIQHQSPTTYDGAYGMTFNAVTRSDTPAGTYTNTGTTALAAYSG